MTPEQITVPRETWDAMLEALELHMAAYSEAWKPGMEILDPAGAAALAAAKAVSVEPELVAIEGMPQGLGNEPEILAQWDEVQAASEGEWGKRQWHSVGAWLEEGDAIAVISDAAKAVQCSQVTSEYSEQPTPPYANCRFRICDLPGQCKGEGKCHHPAIPQAQQPQAQGEADRIEADRKAIKILRGNGAPHTNATLVSIAHEIAALYPQATEPTSRTDYAQAAITLNDAWLHHTGAEPSESVLGRAIDRAAELLLQVGRTHGPLTDEGTKSRCAQCQKPYRHCKTAEGCPKCAPGLSINESEFQKPITNHYGPLHDADAYHGKKLSVYGNDPTTR